MGILYRIRNKNTDTKRQETIKNVEFLYDLKTDNYVIEDIGHSKNITCVNGKCELQLCKENAVEIITLDDVNKTACVLDGVNTELKHLTNNSKIVIEYLKTEGKN